MRRRYMIPVSWVMSAYVTVEAEDLEEAIEEANFYPDFPEDAVYVDDSWGVDAACYDAGFFDFCRNCGEYRPHHLFIKKDLDSIDGANTPFCDEHCYQE